MFVYKPIPVKIVSIHSQILITQKNIIKRVHQNSISLKIPIKFRINPIPIIIKMSIH